MQRQIRTLGAGTVGSLVLAGVAVAVMLTRPTPQVMTTSEFASVEEMVGLRSRVDLLESTPEAKPATSSSFNRQGSFDVVSTKALKIVDDDDVLRATIGHLEDVTLITMLDAEGNARWGVMVNSAGEIGETFSDPGGEERVRTVLNEKGIASFVLQDQTGNQRILLSTTPVEDSAAIVLRSSQNEPTEVFISQ